MPQQLQAMGAFNGVLPQPSGIVVAFFRDPRTMPYLQYSQLVAAPEVQFSWTKLDPNLATRLPHLNTFAWQYDDYRPVDKTFRPRAKLEVSRMNRWNFSYVVGNASQRVWQNQGINYQALCDSARMNHAHLHRAVRVLDTLANASWLPGYNAATLAELVGETEPVSFKDSSGQQYLATGAKNPHFQVIKRALQTVKRAIKFNCNNAVQIEDFQWVLNPVAAQVVARSGEMVEFLKGSPYAKEVATGYMGNAREYDLPAEYGGFRVVVEDTPRVIVTESENDDGEIDDVTVPDQKSYILGDNTCYFTCRVKTGSQNGGLDGSYGTQTYSTVQIFHLNGEARVEAFSEPKHDLVEGNIVMEDKAVVPTTTSAFRLTEFLGN
jgi:hypothetical protein